MKVEVIVSAVPVEDVIEAARKALYTGNIGDGKIFVYDVENVVKVVPVRLDLMLAGRKLIRSHKKFFSNIIYCNKRSCAPGVQLLFRLNRKLLLSGMMHCKTQAFLFWIRILIILNKQMAGFIV